MVPGAGIASAPSAWKAVMHLSTPPGHKLVELDGYAPSRPHCRCGMLLLSSQPQGKMDTTAGIAPAVTPVLRTGPFAARARRGNPRLRSLGVGRFLRASALNDRGFNMVEPAGVAPALYGLKVRCADC